MGLAFDLTDIKPINKTGNQPIVPTTSPPIQQVQQPTPDSSAPNDINEALTKPINTGDSLTDEEGNPWKDKRPPGVKRRFWSVDKFSEPGNNLPVDKEGFTVIRSKDLPKSTDKDGQ